MALSWPHGSMAQPWTPLGQESHEVYKERPWGSPSSVQVEGQELEHKLLSFAWKSLEGIGVLVGQGRRCDFLTACQGEAIAGRKWVAVAKRGEASIQTVVEHAEEFGASAVGLADIRDVQLPTAFDLIPVAVVSLEDGEAMAGRWVSLVSSAMGEQLYMNTIGMQKLLLEEFRLLGQMFRFGVLTLASGPAAFIMAYAGVPKAVFGFGAIMGCFLGGWAELAFMDRFEAFAKTGLGHLPHIGEIVRAMRDPAIVCKTSLVCIPAWLFAFAEDAVEVVDPWLDGLQVGRAFTSLDNETERVFRESWKHICAKDGAVWFMCPTYLGLPYTLLAIFVLSLTIAPCLLARFGYIGVERSQDWLLDYLESDKPRDELEDHLRPLLRLGRLTRWSGMMMLADAFNMPLVGALSRQLLNKDSITGDKVIISYTRFASRTLFEGLPMMWFQISLLGLSWQSSSRTARLFNLFSILTSFKATLTNTIGATRELLTGDAFEALDMAWTIGGVLRRRHALVELRPPHSRSSYPPEYPFIANPMGSADRRVERLKAWLVTYGIGGIGIIVSYCGMGMCLMRLYATLYCEDHIFNLRHMSFTDWREGCFEL